MGKGRGRPSKSGQRKPSGRLKQRAPAIDYGNEKVVALLSVFRPFQGGKADQWVSRSPIGRAWAVGLLDGYGVDAAAIRDAGERYGELRRSYGYNITSGVANYEGQDRRGSRGSDHDPSGELYKTLDKLIFAAGWSSYDAVQALCCDYLERPWEQPPWLERLINEKLAAARMLQAGYLPALDRSDHGLMKLAVEGLLTIVQGTNRRGGAFGRSEAA